MTDEKPAADMYVKAADRLRDTMRWLVAALGAVGVALLAGLSLSNLGSVTGRRLYVAIGAFCIALLGIIVAMVICARMIGYGVRVGTKVLSSERAWRMVQGDDTLTMMFRYEGVNVGAGNLKEVLASKVKKQRRLLAVSSADPGNPDKKAAYDAADEAVIRLNAVIDRVSSEVSYAFLQRRFTISAFIVGGLTLVIGGSIGAFAWSSNPPKTVSLQLPTVVRVPTQVNLYLTDQGKQKFARIVGTECVKDKVLAVVVEQLNQTSYRLAVAKSDSCRPVVIDVEQTDGRVALPQ